MNTRIPIIAAVSTVIFLAIGCSQQVSFEREVAPILSSNCATCHDGSGEGSAKSGFNLLTYESLMQGTKFGPVINPGNRASSTLYRLIAHKVDPEIQMPPHHDSALTQKKMTPLTASQIEIIGQWIDQGAMNN